MASDHRRRANAPLPRVRTMTAKIIDGVAISKSIRQECKQKVQNLQAAWNITPCLVVILVGENPASKIYVRNKMKAAEDVGVISRLHEFPSTIDPDTVLKLIDELNADLIAELRVGKEGQEGLSAFFDKRPPAWKPS